MSAIRTLIVDDEPLARDGIRLRLEQRGAEFQLLRECGNGGEAVEAIGELAPDLVFLDVQMPGLTGFGVLERIPPGRLPLVVFVTAFDRYALQAFRVYALDYLLKPFDDERFAETLSRVRARVEERRTGEVGRRLSALLDDVRAGLGPHLPSPAAPPPASEARRFADRLVIRDATRVTFVRVEEVDWIEADGDYMRLHVGGKPHLLRTTMAELERRLDPERFLRIHRSAIVNFDRVRELRPSFHGEYAVILHDGTRLKLSRGYRDRLQAVLDERL